MPKVLGVDIGGSGVKGAPVDVKRGSMVTDRKRYATPQPSTPDAVLDTVVKIASKFAWAGRVGCTVPAVVQHGVVRSAANIDDAWIGFDAAASLSERLGQPVVFLNDADAAGIAEMRFGAGQGEEGVTLVLTFGTGIGSAVFSGDRLVPNTELGHVELHGDDAEHYAAARLVERDQMDLRKWAKRVNEYLTHMEALFSPDLIIFGGGISKRFVDFRKHLKTKAELVPAELRNNAGIVGAAVAAHTQLG